jgi:hypothetical protein
VHSIAASSPTPGAGVHVAERVDVSAHAEELRTRGFTLLPALVDPAEVAGYAAALREQWRRLGEPELVAQVDRVLEPGVHLSPVGLTFAGVVERIPELAALLLRPDLRALFGALLGPAFELEYGAGVISDHTRGFFFWHHHVGGIDAEDVRRFGEYPRFDRVERIGCTLYASPLDDEHGVMLVWPRRADDPTKPPFTPGREPWPGAVEVRAPAGSVIVFDQGTWHAVTPMRREAQRSFFGFFVRHAELGPSKREDAGLQRALDRDPALAQVYRGGADGTS